MVFCSIAAPATLAQARVLAAGIHRQHPDAKISVLLVGDAVVRPGEEEFETLTFEDLDGRPSPGAATVEGLTNALRPRLLAHLLERGAEIVIYLDPQVGVYGSLQDAAELAAEHGVVLVRRTGRLPEDGERPNDADLLAAGRISPAFVAVSAGGAGQRFVRWWEQRVQAPGGSSAHWLDLAGDVVPSTMILSEPGYNVSYWNVHDRRLERRANQLLAAGDPLRFIDFAGFRPDRPYLLTDATARVSLVDDPVLAELCGEYAELVMNAGWSAPRVHLDTAQQLGNGLPMDELMRSLWSEAVAAGRDFGDPSTPLAAEGFTDWLREPAEHGGDAGVNRYVYAAYRRRPDLQQAFGDLDGDGGPGLITWAWEHGRRELGLMPELLPAAPGSATIVADAHLAVNVIGYLRDTLGLAEAARLYIESLAAAAIPVSTTAVAPDLPVDPSRGKTITRYGHHPYEERRAGVEPAINLACVNGDQLAALVRRGGDELLGGRPTIGQWAFETDVIPPSWYEGFRYVDEIWVNSSFVAQNLGRLSPVPVVVVPQAIVVPDVSDVEVELARDERFTFLFMLDMFSTVQRKNAPGLIDAFMRAFAPGEGPRLLIKTINAQFRRPAFEQLRWQMRDRPDIDIVDGFLDAREKTALLARADCYVSLHRSEGFGLTLAESMLLGTPVIATGYSGNMDFTTPLNSYLVDWTPTRVGPDCDVYPPEGTWAEPDLDHAAELMRRVWQQPQEAEAKVQRARQDIQRLYDPAVVGRIARARLERFREARSGASSKHHQNGGALSTVDRELAFDLRRGTPARRGPSSFVRRAVLRLMLPFTLHERNLDRALVDALRELRIELDRERAQGARARARLRRVEQSLARTEGQP